MTVTQSEPIATLSPELVLVDAELARDAREALTVSPWSCVEGSRRRSVDDAGPSSTFMATASSIDHPVRPSRDNRRAPLRVLSVVAVAAVVASVGSAGFSQSPTPPAMLEEPSTSSARIPDADNDAESPTKTQLVSRATSPVPSDGADTTEPQRAARTAPLGTGAAPRELTLRWRPEPAAASYHVKLLRGERVVLARTTRAPSLALPSEWRHEGVRMKLVRGSYRWYVWAVVDARWTAAPIEQSAFVWP